MEYDWPPSRWRRYLRAQLDGAYSRPFIGSLRGRDLGYVELYRAARDSIATRYAADPHDLGLHAAIADEKIVNRGFGPILLPRIVASVFEHEPRCRRIMFDPDHRNTGARRLCEWAGAPSSANTTWRTGEWRCTRCRVHPPTFPTSVSVAIMKRLAWIIGIVVVAVVAVVAAGPWVYREFIAGEADPELALPSQTEAATTDINGDVDGGGRAER